MCEKHFKIGDIVFIDARQNILFCYPDDSKITVNQICYIKWIIENSKGCLLEVAMYGEQ